MGQSTMRGGGGLTTAVSQEQDHYAPLFKEGKMAHSQNLIKHPPATPVTHIHVSVKTSPRPQLGPVLTAQHQAAWKASEFPVHHWCPVLFTDERRYKLDSKNKVTLTFPRLQDWLFLNLNTPTHCLVVFSVSQSFILIVRKLLRQTSLTLVFLFFF